MENFKKEIIVYLVDHSHYKINWIKTIVKTEEPSTHLHPFKYNKNKNN